MARKGWLAVIAVALVIPAIAFAAPSTAPVQVMVVGLFHMANPGRDLHNLRVDDVLAPKRQAEIARVNAALARFHPTQVLDEWPAAVTAERYPKYLAGTLPPSPNESVQLSFRLAKTAGLQRVEGIDVDGDFPYDAVSAWAAAHGKTAMLEAANADVQRYVEKQGRLLNEHGVAATLRFMNDPARIATDNGFYRQMLAMGGGDAQPGADLLTAWYHRNFVICAHIMQLAHPGDRIVVFYGAGHAFLLRQCVSEAPGFQLVEPNVYLPK